MKNNFSPSLLDLITNMPVNQWDYYAGVINYNLITNPFTTNALSHNDFIERYFERGGKVEVLRSSGITTKDLRLPNHINSVFFLGILIYYNTDLHKKYQLENNDPGYSTFPFIWFLIALFHDNAYQMEDENCLKDLSSINDLQKHFEINHYLFKEGIESNCKLLLDSREAYFNYRKSVWKVVDHGILGGILLYDRLVKIRREKKQKNEDNYFWGKNLESQYLLAGCAISLHNIWLPQKGMEEVYQRYGLDNLLTFRKIKFLDFPLFYILGIVDTLEPLKTYNGDGFSDKYILENLYFDFKPQSLAISFNEASDLDFCKLKEKTKYFKDWLDVEIQTTKNSFEIIFS